MISRIIQAAKNASPQAKARMALAAAVLAGLGLGSLWLDGLQDQLSSLSGGQQGAVLDAAEGNFVTIESFRRADGVAEIYFKLKNDTKDVVALPAAEDISLDLGEQTIQPDKLLDRQGNRFASKALSQSEYFGIMVFPDFDQAAGVLTLDNFVVETRQDSPKYRQTLRLDFEQLQPLKELRS